MEEEMLYRRKDSLDCLLSRKWSGGNGGAIGRFRRACFRKGLSLARVVRMVQILWNADRFFKRGFDVLAERDFEDYHDYLKREMTPQSVYTYMTVLKQFYKWLGGGKALERIRLSKPKSPYSADDLYTEEEQRRMIEAAPDPFWKAFLDGFRYSRCRPAEFLLLKRKDVAMNGMGIILSIPKRKNSYSERTVIIKESCPHFRKWVEGVGDPKKYVFLRDGWTYAKYRLWFRKIAEMAGIRKRYIRLYLFRHSRYTLDWERGVSAEVRDSLYGHSPDSRMRSYYLHLNQAMVNGELERVFNGGGGNHGKVVVVNPYWFGGNN